MYISVTDQDINPEENANPVKTLRLRCDEWRKAPSSSVNHGGKHESPSHSRSPAEAY